MWYSKESVTVWHGASLIDGGTHHIYKIYYLTPSTRKSDKWEERQLTKTLLVELA